MNSPVSVENQDSVRIVESVRLVEAVRIAYRLREAGDARAALSVLAAHPDEAAIQAQYPTFFIVKAECELGLGARAESLRSLKTALRLSPNSARPALLIEALRVESSAPEPETFAEEKNERITLGLLLDAEPIPEPKSAEPELPSFNLEAIAMRLSAERPIVRPLAEVADSPKDSPATVTSTLLHEAENGELGLVSETLAEIMTHQGKIDDARKVYIQLARLHPLSYDYFKNRIEELDDLALRLSQPFE